MTLSRLGRPHVEAMVERVTGGKTLPAEVVQQIVVKTDGVPLFVEELTKTVVESGLLREEGDRYVGAHGSAPIPPLAIPSTLQDSLMARLDRLGPVKELAQLGATLGREFSYELLHAVSPLDEDSLQQGLRQLVKVELLYQHGLPPHATYLFKHALIQDTAYQSLLKSTRQQYHAKIAQVLADYFPETVKTQPELVAHHYTEAGLREQAIPYWQQAGQRAVQRSANREGINHLTKGLELLKTLPDTPERAQQELSLQLALGTALQATRGWGSREVQRVYTRARELCRELGETPQILPVLGGLSGFHLIHAEYQTARELAEQQLRLAQSTQDSTMLVNAHYVMGMILYLLGEFLLARKHFEQGLVLYDPQKHSPQISSSVFVQDPGVTCLSVGSWVSWFLGYADQALKKSQEAITLVHGLSHPFSLAYALCCSTFCYQLRREARLTQEQAEKVITVSTEQGIRVFLEAATQLRTWALTEQGQEEEIRRKEQERITGQIIRAKMCRSYFLALLVEVCGRRGRVEEGLALLVEALAWADKTRECFYEAELYRLRGELTLQQGKVESPKSKVKEQEAEECFLKAIEVARKQHAKSLELRAVMSLSRLWQSQGKTKEAHGMLAEIYNWFTEGFDTKDLQEAKRLIEELS